MSNKNAIVKFSLALTVLFLTFAGGASADFKPKFQIGLAGIAVSNSVAQRATNSVMPLIAAQVSLPGEGNKIKLEAGAFKYSVEKQAKADKADSDRFFIRETWNHPDFRYR